MEFKLTERIYIFAVKFNKIDYIVEERERGAEGDNKMYTAKRKDGTAMTNVEVNALIKQFKLEQQ
jgi:hypothetical protein